MDAEKRLICEMISENPRLSTSKLKANLHEETRKSVSRETIRKSLHSCNLKSRVAAVKPLLTNLQKKVRFDVATEWSRWPFRRFKETIFSDESRFDLFQGDGRCKVWRSPGTRYDMSNCSPSIKGGKGSVMVWGCIGYKGVGRLAVIEGNMDSITYTRVLSTHLHESVDLLDLNADFTFQQDNAPCHKSKYTMEFFRENGINLLNWPAQSPDLNPIEHVWAYIGQKLEKRVIKTRSELVAVLVDIWNSIPASYVKKLYESIPKRLEAVIRAEGGHIPY